MEPLIKGSSDLNKMFLALKKTASSIRRDFIEIENLQSSINMPVDFVRKASIRIEEIILNDLKLVYPSAGLLTPNVNIDGYTDDVFILSISGVSNFVRGNSDFALSLALSNKNNVSIALVYLPIFEKLYYAEKDEGAYFFDSHNSYKIKVSSNVNNCVIATDSFNLSLRSYENLRISGCVALDLINLASGKIDGLIMNPKDYAEIAAGSLILQEAGGFVKMDDYLLATNNKIKLNEE